MFRFPLRALCVYLIVPVLGVSKNLLNKKFQQNLANFSRRLRNFFFSRYTMQYFHCYKTKFFKFSKEHFDKFFLLFFIRIKIKRCNYRVCAAARPALT